MPPTTTLRETAVALARSGVSRHDARLVLGAAMLMMLSEHPTPGVELVRGDRWAPPDGDDPVQDFSSAALLRLASRIAVDQGDPVAARAAAEIAGGPAVTFGHDVPPVLGVHDTVLTAILSRAARALSSVRGAVGGAVYEDGFVREGDGAEYRISFEGGYVPNAIVIFTSRPGARLECALYEGDREDQRISSSGGECTLQWKQRYEGRVTLRIRNEAGGTYYTLTTN